MKKLSLVKKIFITLGFIYLASILLILVSHFVSGLSFLEPVGLAILATLFPLIVFVLFVWASLFAGLSSNYPQWAITENKLLDISIPWSISVCSVVLFIVGFKQRKQTKGKVKIFTSIFLLIILAALGMMTGMITA